MEKNPQVHKEENDKEMEEFIAEFAGLHQSHLAASGKHPEEHGLGFRVQDLGFRV